jgi:hypothetical protein
MGVQDEIESYIADQPAPKAAELRDLHRLILTTAPDSELWFLDGRNSDGKVVTNPNIGYGRQTTGYAGGETRDFYRVGLSANTAGISVYIMGLPDKTHLARTYGARLGKAKVTGYCIKFRSARDIDLGVFEEIVADAMGRRAGV